MQAALSLLLFAVTISLRAALSGLWLPDGALLEALAEAVQGSETAVAEAVVTFCREMIINAT